MVFKMHIFQRLIFKLSILAVAGCVNSGPRPIPELLPEIHNILEVAEADVWRPDIQAQQPLVFDDPQTAQRWAVAYSPVFKHLLAELEVADARIWQQSLLSNPGLEFGLFEPESGGRWRLEAGLHFALFSVLSRERRLDVAQAEHILTQVHILAEISKYLTQIRNHWLEYVAAQQRFQIHAALLESANLANELAGLMRDAGNLSEFDHLLHESAAADQQRQIRAAEMTLLETGAKLRAILGLDPATELVVPQRLPDYSVNTEFDTLLPDETAYEQTVMSAQLLEFARDHNPTLKKLAAELDQQIRQEEAIAQRRALMNAGFSVQREREYDGQQHHGLAVSLSPPLFDRGQADFAMISAQSQAMIAAHSRQLAITHNEISLALQKRRLSRLNLEQLELFDLPRYQRLQELALLEYNFMLRGGFDLLQLREQTLQAQLRQVDALLGWWQASADLAHTIGLDLTIEDMHYD
jgi:outer membrane protein, heavy metal efflux system